MEVWKEITQSYMQRGAPGDQGVLMALLRHLQEHWGGSLPASEIGALAAQLGVKESFLQAVVRRVPGLRVGRQNVLELCAGPNCGKSSDLALVAEKLCKQYGVRLQFSNCMRMCGKGPNGKLNGTLYHNLNEQRLKALLEKEAR